MDTHPSEMSMKLPMSHSADVRQTYLFADQSRYLSYTGPPLCSSATRSELLESSTHPTSRPTTTALRVKSFCRGAICSSSKSRSSSRSMPLDLPRSGEPGLSTASLVSRALLDGSSGPSTHLGSILRVFGSTGRGKESRRCLTTEL